MGLKCPGARTDAFFVHTVVDAAATMGTLKPRDETSLLPTSANKCLSLRLPAPQPSPAGALDQLFVSHFIDNFFGAFRPSLPVPGGSSRIWLHELPQFLASGSPSPVQSSIRAASMLSYGTAVGDASIKTEACMWYMRALQSLRLLLSRNGSLASPEVSVCAAVMLIHFETQAGTSPRAWLKHVKGAASLLEEQGPERCRTGFLHQIFSNLRLQTVRFVLLRVSHGRPEPLWPNGSVANVMLSLWQPWLTTSFMPLHHLNGPLFPSRFSQSSSLTDWWTFFLVYRNACRLPAV